NINRIMASLSWFAAEHERPTARHCFACWIARAKLDSRTTSTSLDSILFVRVWSAKMNPIVLKKAQGHAATFSSRLVLRPTTSWRAGYEGTRMRHYGNLDRAVQFSLTIWNTAATDVRPTAVPFEIRLHCSLWGFVFRADWISAPRADTDHWHGRIVAIGPGCRPSCCRCRRTGRTGRAFDLVRAWLLPRPVRTGVPLPLVTRPR